MIKMRFIFIALLTLTLSCANTKPEPAETTGEDTELTIGTEDANIATSATASETSAAASTETAPPQNKNYARLPKAERQAIDSTLNAKNVQKKRAREAAKLAAERAAEKAAAEEAHAALLAQQAAADAAAAAAEAELAAAKAAEEASTAVAGAESLASASLPAATVDMSEVNTLKQRFLPTTRPRIDREINKIKYVYKGEVIMGMTASYGTLTSEDTDIMLILDNINADATMATVKPFVGYFYRDNNCIGVRFGYRHMDGSLKSADFDLGESNDASFDIPQLSLNSNSYSVGIFHRSYAGLDPKGRFGLFAEFELMATMGHSKDAHERDGKMLPTISNSTQIKLAFNPGFSVFIFPNVSAGVSFGLGGIQYTKINQKDEAGVKIGSREASSMNFRFNVTAINFGMTIHLWDKKKQ